MKHAIANHVATLSIIWSRAKWYSISINFKLIRSVKSKFLQGRPFFWFHGWKWASQWNKCSFYSCVKEKTAKIILHGCNLKLVNQEKVNKQLNSWLALWKMQNSLTVLLFTIASTVFGYANFRHDKSYIQPMNSVR